MVLTYGGGDPVVSAYRAVGARACIPLYNALDPAIHFRVGPRQEFTCDLGLLANRLPDREARVERFFLDVAKRLSGRSFLLGGSGWEDRSLPANVRAVGHVGTADHNSFFCSGLAMLNINRDSMARYGFAPPTRIFEAAGCGACLISDAWPGIDSFLEPGLEVLVARDGEEVAEHLTSLNSERARAIAGPARRRIMAHHTYRQRAQQFDRLFAGFNAKGEAAE
jgi:spore maturation protein CgeB